MLFRHSLSMLLLIGLLQTCLLEVDLSEAGFPGFGIGTVAAQDEVNEIVARIWTDRENRQVSATFKAKLGDRVKVEKYNGEMTSFPYNALVEEDQLYVDAVVRKFGSAPGARTWGDTSGNNFRGSFVKLAKSELEFLLLDEEKKMRIETIFLTSQDVDFILQELNQALPRARVKIAYRVWSYKDANGNALQTLGRYKRLSGEKVVLTQRDEVHMIPLSRLDPSELDYIITIEPSTRSVVAGFQDPQVSGGDGKSERRKSGSANAEIKPIWWISIGLIFLLLLTLISIKYVYESGAREWDDEI
ncbi:MAG: hypothetical protein VX768_02895 [Planctomycetota bacterium]|nr:hypothetical protein [Planctomycetota bacterium]